MAAPVAIACPIRRGGSIDGEICCGVDSGWAIRNHLNKRASPRRRCGRIAQSSLLQIEPLAKADKRQCAAADHVMLNEPARLERTSLPGKRPGATPDCLV